LKRLIRRWKTSFFEVIWCVEDAVTALLKKFKFLTGRISDVMLSRRFIEGFPALWLPVRCGKASLKDVTDMEVIVELRLFTLKLEPENLAICG